MKNVVDKMRDSALKTANGIAKVFGNYDVNIFDSGQRREFETGAVRDMAEGKGRYDLLPREAIEELPKHCERGAIKYGERKPRYAGHTK